MNKNDHMYTEQITENIFSEIHSGIEINKKSYIKFLFTKVKKILKLIILVLLTAVIVFLIINNITIRFKIDGVSMEPCLKNKSFVLIDRLALFIIKPERGDVIAFSKQGSDDILIKRIIGLPGETVKISDSRVYINDVELFEPYIKTRTTGNINSLILGDNEYFVLGDNRICSKDSRNFGLIKKSEISGYVRVVYWPLENWKIIKKSKYKK